MNRLLFSLAILAGGYYFVKWLFRLIFGGLGALDADPGAGAGAGRNGRDASGRHERTAGRGEAHEAYKDIDAANLSDEELMVKKSGDEAKRTRASGSKLFD